MLIRPTISAIRGVIDMSLMETVKGMFTSERKDVYRCDECSEIVKVDTGTAPGDCPACGSDDLSIINRRAKA